MSIVIYSSIFRRFAAFIIDLPFIIILYYLCDGMCFVLQDAWGFAFGTHIIMYIIIIILYECMLECSPLHGTLGKMLIGIEVLDSHDGTRITFMTALVRFFVKIASILLFGLGIIIIIFTKKHQGFHDLIAGTVVVKE
ncbi:MAG TPA: hypothetical protein ENL10_03490 [Candidatus Cloacimonetes bacterium]|nr:RDD family protein [Candidatus Cloacimonadota bacterium]HHE40547.1 hypothetical protein [Candidatus Cloacimonadota bacterium]